MCDQRRTLENRSLENKRMEETMSEDQSGLKVGRRAFLGGVGIAGAAAALSPAVPATAQTPVQAAQPTPAPQPAGYTYLKPQEVLFVEAVVDHMVPRDELTPSG